MTIGWVNTIPYIENPMRMVARLVKRMAGRMAIRRSTKGLFLLSWFLNQAANTKTPAMRNDHVLKDDHPH
ncbi:hypothetical protein D3C76_1816860 [compost metagenome]